MRIHTNILTSADIRSALTDAGLDGVWLDECTERGSRARRRAFEVRLAADPKPGRNRRRNTGWHGAEDAGQPALQVAATYAEHGRWMAQIYRRDPHAIVAQYVNEGDFHFKTRHQFHIEDADALWRADAPHDEDPDGTCSDTCVALHPAHAETRSS
jgi:hypothetical protein